MADVEGKKRAKKPNFTKEEIGALVTAIGNRKKEIMGKFEGGLGKVRQMNAWVAVQREVKETSQNDRSVEELKKKWSDLRIESKKKIGRYEAEKRQTGGGDAPHRPDDIYFIVVDIIGPESVEGVIGGVDSSLPAGPSGMQQQEPSSQDPTPPTPKRRRLESQRDQQGRDRQEMISIQREILAAVSRLADYQAQLVDVAKRWLALEEYKTFNGGHNCQGSSPNF